MKKYKVKVDLFCGYHTEPLIEEDVLKLLNFHNLNKDLLKDSDLFEEIIIQDLKVKLITEEGDKLYGNDNCWFITDLDSKFQNDSLYNWDGGSILNGKYFSKRANAEQYFIKLQVKKEGLRVGTELDLELIRDWRMQSNNEFIRDDLNSNIIFDFIISRNVLNIHMESGHIIPIAGFKKFKEEWEIKQSEVKDSSSDIPKERCDNCAYFHTGSKICADCYLAPHEGEGDNWKQKDIVFEESEGAKIIKPRLMLGNVEVTINEDTQYIYAAYGKASFKQWISWAEYIEEISENGVITEFILVLNLYQTILHPRTMKDNSIGCINGVSWEQIKNITKVIEKL